VSYCQYLAFMDQSKSLPSHFQTLKLAYFLGRYFYSHLHKNDR
jgi:hypothetical protein